MSHAGQSMWDCGHKYATRPRSCLLLAVAPQLLDFLSVTPRLSFYTVHLPSAQSSSRTAPNGAPSSTPSASDCWARLRRAHLATLQARHHRLNAPPAHAPASLYATHNDLNLLVTSTSATACAATSSATAHPTCTPSPRAGPDKAFPPHSCPTPTRAEPDAGKAVCPALRMLALELYPPPMPRARADVVAPDAGFPRILGLHANSASKPHTSSLEAGGTLLFVLVGPRVAKWQPFETSKDSTPVHLHCSAGSRRTGGFIAIDALRGKIASRVGVPGTLRARRCRWHFLPSSSANAKNPRKELQSSGGRPSPDGTTHIATPHKLHPDSSPPLLSTHGSEPTRRVIKDMRTLC
ncbi:uncharacterized protein BXZ73DRAFT_105182 [Epithele typhae]|uniref:uncharacterized protein n=1 Tax=Epithele typhae TaxID=378194 RepID=UPI0020074C50|nr:uncharacterized protein BXZ73DRAFT_105182 [Epithele typhae]KAH9918547.1 hypothetical protein BXZ73DRAFT_105182 [Epithele typhae]